MLIATHYYRQRYPRLFRRSRPSRSCADCGCVPATRWVARLNRWLCATCLAVDRIRLLRRFAAASDLPRLAEWANWELGRIVAAFETRKP